MQKRKLGQLEVSALGLGCMGMSEFYGPSISEDKATEIIKNAFDMGINFFDTADMYGFGDNEIIVGKALKPVRSKVVIATKFGVVRKKEDPQFRKIDGSPAYVKSACEASLKRLGVSTIDLYYQHRTDPNTPIEETIGAMVELVKEGKVRFIGLSEVSPEIIQRAYKVHPLTAVQTEYSIWTRGPEDGVLETCRQLGIGFVPYSPIGRGFLTGKIISTNEMLPDDFRKTLPRFQEENIKYNLKIVDVLKEMAAHKGCTPSQLALAWVLAQSKSIVPIPGTTNVDHLRENVECLKIEITPTDLVMMDELIPSARGERFGILSMQNDKLDKLEK